MARLLMIAYTTYVNDGRVKRHAQALADRGDQIDVICLANPQQGLRDGVNVIGLRMNHYRGSSRVRYILSYLRFFADATLTASRLCRQWRYDAAIVCTMPDAAVLCAIPARLMGAKVVLDIHDTMPELYRDKFRGVRGRLGARLLQIEERASTAMAHRVLAVHDLHRQRLEETGVRRAKIRVVVNTPDSRIFSRRKIASAAAHDFTIVCHGTVARRLGLDVAIESMGILRKWIPSVRMLLIGSGDYLPDAKALATRLGLDDRVQFLPPVPLEQLPSTLSGASIGLVPNHASSATHLMLPVKLLEYAALGIPVVASRLRTIEHYFGAGAVRLFEPGNPTELARAIEELYLSSGRREKLVRAAEAALDRIDWREQRANFYQAIDSVLKPKSVRDRPDARRTQTHAQFR
ncbi:MAG: glycosyltransferase family 4 protein [Candidatus Binataceae bacterium]